jgi:hypothetical protein
VFADAAAVVLISASLPQEDDPIIVAMATTDEGKKVTRNGGSKYVAVFKRIPCGRKPLPPDSDDEDDEKE